MKWDFEGKTVVITGAAQGIGYQVAKGVVEGGGHAVILNLNEEKAKKAAEQLGNADAYKIDCGNPQNIRAVMVQVLKDQRCRYHFPSAVPGCDGCGMGEGNPHQSDRCVYDVLRYLSLLYGTWRRPYRERCVGCGQDRRRSDGYECVRCFEGWRHWSDEGNCKGRRQISYFVQRCLPVSDEDADDFCFDGRDAEADHLDDSAGTCCRSE